MNNQNNQQKEELLKLKFQLRNKKAKKPKK